MTRSRCPRTSELLAALRRRSALVDGRAHLESCRECADALLVERFLAGEAAAAAAEARPPDPAVVRWRARRARRSRAASRALSPIAVWERIAAVAAAAGIGAAILVGGLGGLAGVGDAFGSLFAGAGSGLTSGLPMAAATLLIAVAAGGVYWVWAEEPFS